MRAFAVAIVAVSGLALAACSQSGYRNIDTLSSVGTAVTPETMSAEAEAGNVEAQRVLGNMYHWGEGVAQDDAKAKLWWGKAAANGDQRAQAYLDAPKNNRAVPGELRGSVGRDWWAAAERSYDKTGDYFGLCETTC